LASLFAAHERRWRQFHYVYPVISRRARGLSIGVNLSPGAVCNFGCVYCQVNRAIERPVHTVKPAVLERELRFLVANHRNLFEEREFRHAAPEYRRLNDIAFSGDGEPTASPVFPEAARIAAVARRDFAPADAKIVLITNACFLNHRPVADTLAFLDQHNMEIWAKLDAGTEEYFRRVNRASCTLQHVLDNILAAARARPLVIQSLFPRVHDERPPPDEIDAWVDRLRTILDSGGRISLVQIYSVARRPAEPYVSPLTADELEQISAAVRPLGLSVECYS